jgi:hypothetical protein
MVIHKHFLLGFEGIHAWDHYFMKHGQESILALPSDNKKAWLSGAWIMRQGAYLAKQSRLRVCMVIFMLHWPSTTRPHIQYPGLPGCLGSSHSNPVEVL